MESSQALAALNAIVRGQDEIIKLLRRVEAVLIASTGKIPVEGSFGAVIAVDGHHMATEDMLSFVDSKLEFIPRGIDGYPFVWDSSCPKEPDHLYQLPGTRDYKIQPLSYKEAVKILDTLLPNRYNHRNEKSEP